MPPRSRPLSPHLQVYRWQMGNSMSILHRGTGMALAVGLLALSYWLISVAGGEASYGAAMRLFLSPLGLLFLAGWTFSFFYHLLNGVRHLFWDAGFGFERPHRHVSGWAVLIGAVGVSAGVCMYIWHGVHS